jgi:hypothetical protein
MSGNKSFTMMVPDLTWAELEEMALQYKKPSVQELLRLITKNHLREVNGPSRLEELRLKGPSGGKFILAKCPKCHLSIDMYDYPVLARTIEGWKCNVCSSEGDLSSLK